MTGSASDVTRAGALKAIMAAPTLSFQSLKELFFTDKGEGTPVKWVTDAKVLKSVPAIQMALQHEQDRLSEVREQVAATEVARDTVHALTLADAYLTAYTLEKVFAGRLDFADLIEKTHDLTANAPQAAWVLFKLDGGINHILVDEAQDTAPDQWRIIRALTEDFFAGEGRERSGDLARNMFVVGDEKQSIYSFQGAAPENLVQEFDFHHARATGAGQTFERVDLLASWRSATRILNFVDATFAAEDLAASVLPRRRGAETSNPSATTPCGLMRGALIFGTRWSRLRVKIGRPGPHRWMWSPPTQPIAGWRIA